MQSCCQLINHHPASCDGVLVIARDVGHPNFLEATGATEVKTAMCGDIAMKLDQMTLDTQCAAVDKDPSTASASGCHGTGLLIKYLPYVNYFSLYQIPVAHALLYGLVKDFLNHVLGTREFITKCCIRAKSVADDRRG